MRCGAGRGGCAPVRPTCQSRFQVRFGEDLMLHTQPRGVPVSGHQAGEGLVCARDCAHTHVFNSTYIQASVFLFEKLLEVNSA